MSAISYEDGAISLAAIQAASVVLRKSAHHTPVLTSTALDALAGLELHFKCEVFQKTGSFKFRGAYNAVSTLPPDAKAVVTHSSGNHAAAVALAAQLRGIPAHIVVPSNTPRIKRSAVASYGGRLVVCEPTMEAREAACAALQRDTGATFIPPFNSAAVICGQGTIGLELMQQVHGLDAIVVPISGGGMCSGIAVAAKSLCPGIKIIAAEPSGRNAAADVAAAKAAGHLVPLPKPDTICDGLQARLGSITWPIIRDLVDEVVVVTEEQVAAAMRLCYERLKVVVEPSGAAGLAAALALKSGSGGDRFAGCERVGVILCGGNVDLDEHVPLFWESWAQPRAPV